MKKLLSLLLFAIIIQSCLNASHIVGGEIGWDCLSNGKLRFFMIIYRDCTGIPFGFNTETLTVNDGTFSYYDEHNQEQKIIILKPDSNRWLNENKGDLTPECFSESGIKTSCNAKSPGSVQAYYYVSDPIILKNRPPKSGWHIYYQASCCRPGDMQNTISNGSLLIRASMYGAKNSGSMANCYDSSPRFEDAPLVDFCRRKVYNINASAIDPDLDSLVYSWDRPYNPGNPPVPIRYKAGFTQFTPIPNDSVDERNIPAGLNRLTGSIRMANFSGGGMSKYIWVQRVDSYRDGIRIASIYREVPISFADCDDLFNYEPNNVPEIRIDLSKKIQSLKK